MDTPALYATAWAVLPPLIAIVLALITKEVYSSLFLGVVTGANLYAGADFDGIVNHILNDGIIDSLSDGWNVGILIFLVIFSTSTGSRNRIGINLLPRYLYQHLWRSRHKLLFAKIQIKHIRGRIYLTKATIEVKSWFGNLFTKLS